ncbi:hypothetical protein PPERSA_00281 [Pseudocohnilembus persalinus]|uniref:ATP-dependent helicase C-terminal domain-containing protein n=1 Tax=Pseudocohnilembus persalinus TaxID=266149 RepID=A0A0V0Q943_PSEPJ|nr:hypothetical protein PPERSA_00281 [Pseudocohnilembus persalinus]|eukprot:KRW98693.1 hypothetical protein PPERSA_00281 [Pseudocohnilembus persalinus]
MDKVVDEINKSGYRPNVLIRKSDFRYYQEEKINGIINQQQIEKNLQLIQKQNLAELTEKLLYISIKDDKQKQVANLQQFEKNCEKIGIHPFLACQILQDKCDILITVSKFFFDDQFLKFQKNWLQDKIIIYDQGHDLAGVCEEMAGVTLNNQDLKNILEILEGEQYKDQGKFLVPELKNLVDQIENQNLMDISQLKHCLTPSKRFKQVSDQNPKCSIITSCSLTPFYILQNSLGIENCEGSYMTDAKKQLFGGLVMNQYERSENIYNFSQKRIEEDKQNIMSNDLGRYIKNIIQYIPNGCIIAFSNKFILENMYQLWNRNRIITYSLEKQCQILGNKEVIYDYEIGKGLFSLKCNLCDQIMGKKIEQQFDDIEVQNDIKCQNCQRSNIKFQLECNKHKQQQICQQCASLEENVLENYKKKAKTEDGAILLTVCKSKNFYDQNFEGELLRGLFMVGLPYFQFNEVVQEKIEFNSFINNNSDWYKQQMYRQIYSTLGRVIRNKDDWGAIYLFDSRFSQNICDFPKFFRDTYKIYQTSGKLIDDTRQFFEGYGCKIQNRNKGIINNNLSQGSKNNSIPSDSDNIQIKLGQLIQNIAHQIKMMENQPYKVIFEVQDEKFVQVK